MEPKNKLPPRVRRLQRSLLAIVVSVLVVFCQGAVVLFVAGSSTRATSRAAAYLLVGASTVRITPFLVAYITLCVLQHRAGGLDANLGRDA